MNKACLLFCIALTPVTAWAQNIPFSDEFIQKLPDCTPFSETKKTEIFGMNVSTKNAVLGKKGDRCQIETVNTLDIGKNIISCSLGEAEIARLTAVLTDDGTQEYTEKHPLFMEIDGKEQAVGESSITGTLRDVTWGALINSPDICKIEFKDDDTKKEFADALEKCLPTEKKFGLMGMEIQIKFAPSSKRAGFCDFMQRASFPSFSVNLNGETKTSPAVTKETRCRLSGEQTAELAQDLRTPKTDGNSDGEKSFIFKKWEDDPAVCSSRETQTPVN